MKPVGILFQFQALNFDMTGLVYPAAGESHFRLRIAASISDLWRVSSIGCGRYCYSLPRGGPAGSFLAEGIGWMRLKDDIQGI